MAAGKCIDILDRALVGIAAVALLSAAPVLADSIEPDGIFAEHLFRENGIQVDASTINRVLRDDIETVVWVHSQFAGLPVFGHDVGYSFDADGSVARDPGTDEIELLGDPLPPASAFPVDRRADIDPDTAIQTWLSRARLNEFFGANFEPTSRPQVTLGFHNLNRGTNREPEYRLAWQVSPEGAGAPVAMVDAKKGDILHFDSGVRTADPVAYSTPGTGDGVSTNQTCHDAVQGKISFDYLGHETKTWPTSLIERLCNGARETTEPARCFEQVTHSNAVERVGVGLDLKSALALCAGVKNADAVIACFESGISKGFALAQAVRSCDTNRNKKADKHGSEPMPKIITVFVCSDYCVGPREQYMREIYEGVVDENECLDLGGKPMTVIGWGVRKYCLVR